MGYQDVEEVTRPLLGRPPIRARGSVEGFLNNGRAGSPDKIDLTGTINGRGVE